MRNKAKPITFEGHVFLIIIDLLKEKILGVEAVQKIIQIHEEFMEKSRI